jgi:DnaJ-domain-containing protein 1
MGYVLWGGAAIVGAVVLYQLMMRANLKLVARYMRWIIGGMVALITAFLLVRGQVAIAGFTGYVAFVILRYGRVGPWSFESSEIGEDNASAVKSRYISMTLDHETGTVEGRVVAGAFKGSNLIDLDEEQTRLLLAEVSADPDSLALLETWLDRNRAGWREYFAGEAWADGEEKGAGSGHESGDPDTEAYEILGLEPGATEDEIRAAYRKLMMGVHPDQGGSEYLAAKINQAKDRLLKKLRR